MNNHEFSNYITNLAIRSILYEVAATPKPGLVDRSNPGAHEDMDFFTFLRSSSTLSFYFYDCTRAGLEFEGKDYRELLKAIRPIGIKAEKDMFKATGGINTHKGMIFSQGIIAAAVGSIYRQDRTMPIDSLSICDRASDMALGLTKELTDLDPKGDLTYGESLYIKYNIKGIRGEVESGFKTVVDNSLPILRELVPLKEHKINDILVHTLLHLMVTTEDGNVLGRHDMKMLIYVRESATKALKLGGYLREEGRAYVKEMDKDFIGKNISPGGAADLLAVTVLLYYLETGDEF